MVSSSQNESVVDSVTRLISSLYGTNRTGGDHNSESDIEETHPMLEVEGDNNDDDDDDVDEREEDDAEENNDKGDAGDDDGNENKIDLQENDEENRNSSAEEDIDNDEDEDEEIESDDEMGEEIIDEEVEEDDDEDMMIHEELMELQRGIAQRGRSSFSIGNSSMNNYPKYPTSTSGIGFKERSQFYIEAAMQVLAVQHPILTKTRNQKEVPLSPAGEKALLSSILGIVKPQKKPLNTRINLRRAPTQEEFFRGALSRNPITLSMLKPRGSDTQTEPTVRDLRNYIAEDLQMGDSAELLELLATNKILDLDLKLRVVNQTVWRDHCIQNTNSSSVLAGGRGGSRSFLASGSGLSLILERSSGSAPNITSDTPLSSLPAMSITYRLIGVDGEATEDTLTTLVDPEAPSESSSPEEAEKLMESQYGITRLIAKDRGIIRLLRSVEGNINDVLKNIRRDDVETGSDNFSRRHFKQSFYPGLDLLICCAKLSSNRRLLLDARAPTILLRVLLDVLHALEDSGDDHMASESNQTARGLKTLIEVLASDISKISGGDSSSNDADDDDSEEDATTTLRLLMDSIETSSLSRPLRNIIAKLLPYLTYGKPKLTKELAAEFMEHVVVENFTDFEKEEGNEGSSICPSVLMDTFIHASASLPANIVCNSLRVELVNCGFVKRILDYFMTDVPTSAPSWSPSLWSKTEQEQLSKGKQTKLETEWRDYSKRLGLKTSLEMVVGLAKEHEGTQLFIGGFSRGSVSFLQVCHWLESSSDLPSSGISLKGLGILAETILDDLVDFGTPVSKKIKSIRKRTRERKKQIAMERRSQALLGMSKFGALAGPSPGQDSSNVLSGPGNNTQGSVRGTAASLLAPVFGLFRDSATGPSANEPSDTTQPASKRRKKSPGKQSVKEPAKPAWMEEMENIEEETGLSCCVCQVRDDVAKSTPYCLHLREQNSHGIFILFSFLSGGNEERT